MYSLKGGKINIPLQIFQDDDISLATFATVDLDFIEYRHKKSLKSLDRRANLGGKKLLLCAKPWPIMTMSDDKGKTFYGFGIDVIEFLQKTMNFTYSYVLPRDGRFGVYDKIKRKWNGMVGQLVRKECDIW